MISPVRNFAVALHGTTPVAICSARTGELAADAPSPRVGGPLFERQACLEAARMTGPAALREAVGLFFEVRP